MKLKHNRLLIMLLIVAMAVCMMPGAGLLTGAEAVYADSIYISGGTVNTSDMTIGADYYFTGDTVINVDGPMSVGAINIGNGVLLTLEGDDSYTLSASKVESYNGSFTMNGGGLEIDSSDSESTWPAAIQLTTDTFKMNGGNLFINFRSYSESAILSYAISAWNVEFNGGTATITVTSYAHGGAYGISAHNFSMVGGDVGINAEARVSSASAGGITAAGATLDANFYMEGGILSCTGWASNAESYGINWTADKTKNTTEIYGGKVEAKGQYRGLCSWAPLRIDGAEINATATGNSAIALASQTGSDIEISGAGTKIIADAPLGYAMVAYDAEITLATYINMVSPAGGSLGPCWTGAFGVLDSSGNTAKYVELVPNDPIPTYIPITYDTSMAFPTTRLTGREVSMYLLKAVTSNPGQDNAHDGWFVYAANPNKTDMSTNTWTCLTRKNGDSFEELNASDEYLNTTDEYYFKFNIYGDGSRPFDLDATYTASVNGEAADVVYQPDGVQGDMFVYQRVFLDETTDVIWDLQVSPEYSKIVKDGFRQFELTTFAATNDAVDWTVTGGSYSGTWISDTGNLHAGAGENAGTILKVRATSKADTSVFDEVTVEVVDEVPVIESVTITCEQTEVCPENTVYLQAKVEGTDIHDVIWELVDYDGPSYFKNLSNTYADLYIHPDETAKLITVKATSKADPTKYDTWDLTIVPKKTVTGPIGITYDESAVTLSESKTGRQVTEEFRNAITSVLGYSMTIKDAPEGWFVYLDPGADWTSLVRWNGHSYESLCYSDDALNKTDEYYLWFNIDCCYDTHFFDSSMDLADLDITVNGHRVNGDTVKAKWESPLEVYVRVYFPGQEPTESPIDRIYGDDRFDTALKAADWLKAQKGLDKFPNIVIASGMNFPDALAGAYLAEVKDAPVLLTSEGTAAKVAEYVKNNMKPDGTVFILGGPGAVPEVVEQDLEALGISKPQIKRLAGDDRYETNILILQEAGVSGQDLLVCTGGGYADSLSASAVGKPVFLVGKTLTKVQKDYLESVSGDISGNFYAIGGTGVVSDEVFDEFKAYGSGEFERVAGDNRFLTSVEIAKKFFKPDKIDSAVLAYAMNYPDGLAGGPVAYSTGSPLLLVTNSFSSDAKDYVSHSLAHKIRVMGGPTLISDEVALAVLDL